MEEQLLRERRLFTGGPVVAFRWRATDGWPVEYVSPNVAILFGHEAADFTGGRVSYASVIHSDDLARVAAEVAGHSEAGVPCFEQEYRIVRPDGMIRWVWDRGFPIRDAAGQVCRVAGIAEDITGRKEAEQQIRESEQRFRAMADSAPVLLWVADACGACTSGSCRMSSAVLTKVSVSKIVRLAQAVAFALNANSAPRASRIATATVRMNSDSWTQLNYNHQLLDDLALVVDLARRWAEQDVSQQTE